MYDIGSVPRRIVDTGDYLYLLTDTRLYVLQDDTLHALVDTLDGGDLIVAQTAFGLLEKKRLRWFREDGRHLGTVLSKDPIRRVYTTGEGMVVESRQRTYPDRRCTHLVGVTKGTGPSNPGGPPVQAGTRTVFLRPTASWRGRSGSIC